MCYDFYNVFMFNAYFLFHKYGVSFIIEELRTWFSKVRNIVRKVKKMIRAPNDKKK